MEVIVFDWDGTLVDTLDGLYLANEAVMIAFGLPFDRALYRRHYAPDWRLMYGRLGVPAGRIDEANELWHRTLAGARAELFDGILGALRRLSAAGFRLGLVTAGNRDVVAPQVARAGLTELLPVQIYGDDLSVHKPDPEPLRRALVELGVAAQPDAAAYVGDAPDDMRMASAVGARAVGILSILGHADDLLAAGASEVAPSVVAWVDTILDPLRRDAV